MPTARALMVAVAATLAALLAPPGSVASPRSVRPPAVAAVPAAEPQPNLLDALGALLSPAPPSGPAALSSPRPAGSSAVSPVADSTVFVSGAACGVNLFGSGWAVAPDTIATNAHVVAGVDDPEVRPPDGRRLRARVVAFDPRRDVAVLRVDGLDERPLATGPAVAGTPVLVHGHPGGQEKLDVARARVIGTERVLVPDIYGRSTSPQDVVDISGDIRRGDSGAAVTTDDGTAVAMIFAVDSLGSGIAYAKTSSDVLAVVSTGGSATVDTGPCLF